MILLWYTIYKIDTNNHGLTCVRISLDITMLTAVIVCINHKHEMVHTFTLLLHSYLFSCIPL